jgi:hypothetical protein
MPVSFWTRWSMCWVSCNMCVRWNSRRWADAGGGAGESKIVSEQELSVRQSRSSRSELEGGQEGPDAIDQNPTSRPPLSQVDRSTSSLSGSLLFPFCTSMRSPAPSLHPFTLLPAPASSLYFSHDLSNASRSNPGASGSVMTLRW